MTDPVTATNAPLADLGPADIRLSQRAADATVVEAEALHRRRLEAAFLHGTARTAADRITVWPWLLVGLLIVALIAAGMGIAHAFRAQQRLNEQQQQQRRGLSVLYGATTKHSVVAPLPGRATAVP